jgi:hypothetical protein
MKKPRIPKMGMGMGTPEPGIVCYQFIHLLENELKQYFHTQWAFATFRGRLICSLISDAASGVDNPLSDGDLPPATGFGSLAQVLEPNSVKTSDKHVTHANNSILLWCGAKLTLNDSEFLEIDKVRWSKFPNSSASLAEATVVIESEPSEVG